MFPQKKFVSVFYATNVYLNYSKCTWKVSILLYKHHAWNQTLDCLRLYGDSRVARAQSRINAYEILLQHDWLLIFSRHNRFAETHSHLQLSYHITDRLLAAGNKKPPLFIKVQPWSVIRESTKSKYIKHKKRQSRNVSNSCDECQDLHGSSVYPESWSPSSFAENRYDLAIIIRLICDFFFLYFTQRQNSYSPCFNCNGSFFSKVSI